jgi:hypothetical protein
MAAILMIFSWLTEKEVLVMNPAREVKTARFGITKFLENGGTLEVAQRIDGRADGRTTNRRTIKRACALLNYRRKGRSSSSSSCEGR